MYSEERKSTDIANVQRLLESELSTKARFAYVALLLISLMVSGVVAALWATEPLLPMRTQLAFAVMLIIGVSWCVFALRALTTRRVLLARQRVIAGRLAVTFTSVYCLGALALGFSMRSGAAFLAAGFGAVMVAVAIALLVRARRNLVALSLRREQLERELGAH